MAVLFAPSVQPLLPPHATNLPKCPSAIAAFSSGKHRRPTRCVTSIASPLCADETLSLDQSALKVAEAVSDEQLWAAARLRVRTFYEFSRHSYRIEDHKKFLAEREFEALKDRIAGKRIGFRKVSCINATLPLSQTLGSAALCSSCKFSENGEDRVVVGSLDLNQCLRLADELSGKRPEGGRANFARGYLSNVCVAKELHRHGVGYALICRSKKIACEWGITDLYAHVAVNNEAARKLYTKSDFLYESDEPAWQARFLERPRRLLLWVDLTPLTNTL